jgi:hypothetical protein
MKSGRLKQLRWNLPASISLPCCEERLKAEQRPSLQNPNFKPP